MKLDLKQKNHLLDRISNIYRQKKDEIIKSFTQEAIILKGDQKLRLIRSGEAKLVDEPISYYAKLFEAFDFSPFERDSLQDIDSINKYQKILENEYQQIRDIIILGSVENPIGLIAEFTVFNPMQKDPENYGIR